jgi:predicted nucleotidyltransferase
VTAAGGLDREVVTRAFGVMADELERQGVRGEILLAGGAVMALEYDATRVTRDVDGLVLDGHGAVLRAADIAAGELGLRRGWLNEGVSVYLSSADDPGRHAIFDRPALSVLAVSTEHLLALKARAARPQDLADLAILTDRLAISTSDEVLAIVERFFPEDPISERARAAIEDSFPPIVERGSHRGA